MLIKDWKKDFFTIPNMLSLFRLLLIPVYIIIYLNADEDIDYYIAGGILAVSCLTDLIDGKIARHFNMISNVGKILDPFADKMTQFALIVCLVIRYQSKYPVLLPMIVLFVIKEIFQIVAGLLLDVYIIHPIADNNFQKDVEIPLVQKFLGIGSAEVKDRLQGVHSLLWESLIQQFLVHIVNTYLVEFVDCYCDINDSFGLSNHFGDTCEDFAVVDMQTHANTQTAIYLLHNLDKFYFTE